MVLEFGIFPAGEVDSSPTVVKSGMTAVTFALVATAKNAGTDTTLYTPTTGKIFHLTSINISNSSGAATSASIQKSAGGTTVYACNVWSVAEVQEKTQTFPCPITFIGGIDIVNLRVGANNGTWTITGQGFEVATP